MSVCHSLAVVNVVDVGTLPSASPSPQFSSASRTVRFNGERTQAAVRHTRKNRPKQRLHVCAESVTASTTITVKPRIEATGFYRYKLPWPPACIRDPAFMRDSASTRSFTVVTVQLTSSTDFSLPQLRTKFGERAFSHAGPAVWNSLPEHIRATPDIGIFRKLLTTHLFNQAFNDTLTSGFLVCDSWNAPMFSMQCALQRLRMMTMMMMTV